MIQVKTVTTYVAKCTSCRYEESYKAFSPAVTINDAADFFERVGWKNVQGSKKTLCNECAEEES